MFLARSLPDFVKILPRSIKTHNINYWQDLGNSQPGWQGLKCPEMPAVTKDGMVFRFNLNVIVKCPCRYIQKICSCNPLFFLQAAFLFPFEFYLNRLYATVMGSKSFPKMLKTFWAGNRTKTKMLKFHSSQREWSFKTLRKLPCQLHPRALSKLSI